MRYQHLIVFFSLLVLTACQISSESLPPEFDKTKIGTTESDVTYCTMSGVPLKMDIYYPSTIQRQWPLVLYVHGGGWGAGDKKGIGFIDIDALQKAGILTVSVDYRLAPQYKFPAMIEDVKCAVRYLRAHAEKYNIDPERFAAIGGSAGGHLVALLGVTDKAAGFDVGEYADYSSRVQAVVSISGLADLAQPFTMQLFFDRMFVFGVNDPYDPIFSRASPVNYITPDDPPFLLVHGELDTTVPIKQSVILYRHLQRAGIYTDLVTVKNADHIFLPVGKGPIEPTTEEINSMIMSFLKDHLLK